MKDFSELDRPQTDEELRLVCLRIAQGCWPESSGMDGSQLIKVAEQFFNYVKIGMPIDPTAGMLVRIK